MLHRHGTLLYWTAALPMSSIDKLSLLISSGFGDYVLMDSGAGRKLERFGKIIVDRPEPQALWQPRLPKAEWAKAYAVFSASGEDDEKGKWRIDKAVPEAWPVKIPVFLPLTPALSLSWPSQASLGRGEGDVTMLCKLAGLWHLGLFPEQRPHWDWMLKKVAGVTGETPRVLNLFGYTGAASLLAAKAGAEVTHVDASKKAIGWAKENQAASKMDAAKIRWMLDDAAKFVAREVRRGRTYHAILVDPPKFGRGADGEVWELFEHLPALLADCVRLLAPERAHLILTAYAIRASALALDGLMRQELADRGGSIESGELGLAPRHGGTVIGTSMYSRWSAP